ncbi:LamG-like jellyroll fold domain-containing protein [Nonomuraea rosea]|uniref:LamG-like jellyroll fold domain-containing protein n=1 Tax=Nonomuraea rosea TaxID=638574 RepID=UPI0031EC5A12
MAAYGMEEGSGGTIHDLSGNGHDGTVRNPQWTLGKIGKALHFDYRDADVDRTVSVPDAPGLRTAAAMTVEAWVKPQSRECTFISKGIEGQDMSFRLASDGWQLRIGGVTHGGYLGLYQDTWLHLAMTYDGTTIRLLGDGYEGVSEPAAGNVDFGDGPLLIGRDVNTTCPEGSVDEVRLYGRALTDEEIAKDMVTAVAPDERPAPPGGLRADVSSGTAELSWQPATDDKGITGYEIYRGEEENFEVSDQTKVATVTGLSYIEGCAETRTYYYRVVALDTLPQASAPTEPISADLRNPDCPPIAPTVKIEPRTGWGRLTFEGASDDRGISEIRLHRSVNSWFTPSDDTLVATLGPDVREYTDEVPQRATYYYRTIAVDTTSHLSEPSAASSAEIFAPPSVSDTLQAAYGLNEGTGTTAYNARAPWIYQGTITNPHWVTGRHGKALAFPTGSMVRAIGLPTMGSATISAWVKPKKVTDYLQTVVLWFEGTGNSFSVDTYDGWAKAPDAGIDGYHVYGPRPAAIDAWVHVAATYDGRFNALCLYVDGERVRCRTDVEASVQGPTQVWIGGPLVGEGPMGSIIDEVRVYSDSLTPKQVTSIMDTPIT